MEAYEVVLAHQNQGIPCPGCNSLSGHYLTCPIFSTEKRTPIDTRFTPEDSIMAHGLGIKL